MVVSHAPRLRGGSARKIAAAVVAVSALTGAALTTAGPASAAGVSVVRSTVLPPANGYYTSQLMSDGTYTYCAADPQPIVLNTGDYSAPESFTGTFQSEGGTTWSGAGLAESGYILSKYGVADGPSSIPVHRAVIKLADPNRYNPGAPGAAAEAQADQMIADARANAPKAAAGYSVNLVIPSGSKTGEVNITGLTGYPGTASILGPAVWANSNSTGTEFTTGQELPQIKVTGNGQVKVSVKVVGIPDTALWVYKSPTSQDVFKSGVTRSASAESAQVPVIYDFQPIATSQAPKLLKKGDPLSSTFTATTTEGDQGWGTDPATGAFIPVIYRTTFYGPFDVAPVESPQAAVDAPVIDIVDVTATAPGLFTATGKSAPAAGFYTSVQQVIKADQGTNGQWIRGDWDEMYGLESQTSLVKWRLQVSTVASKVENGLMWDTYVVTGNQPSAKLTITATPILTSEAPVVGGTDTRPIDAVDVAKVTTEITGNGTFESPKIKAPWQAVIEDKWLQGKKANVSWYETIPETATTEAWTGKYLLPSETVPFDRPVIVTKASPTGQVPLEAYDTGVLTGTVPTGDGVTSETKADLFKWDDSVDGAAQPVCISPTFTSPWQTITSAGDIIYPKTTITTKGTYGWVEALKVTYPGSSGEAKDAVLHTGKCGAVGETVIATELAPTSPPGAPETPVAPPTATQTLANTGANDGMFWLAVAGGGLLLLGAVLTILMVRRRREDTAES